MSSLHADGLPAWLFTPRMAVVSGAAIGILVLLIGSAFSLVGSLLEGNVNSAPACFAIERAVKPGTWVFDRKSFDALRTAGVRTQNVTKVLAVETACQLDACPAAAREQYRQAVRTYIMDRSRAVSGLFAGYGEPGLMYAHWVYDEDVDKAIIQGLRHRYAAGLFDLKRMDNGGHDYTAATRMLLFAAAKDFKPCRV